jgi:hypothetical protein
MKPFSTINIIVIIAVFSACMSVKPGISGSSGRLYETFFVGEAGTQYFIKPITFTNQSKETIEMDFTFRFRDEIKDSAIVNSSIISNNLLRTVDSITINNKSTQFTMHNVNRLMMERKKKKYESRFSSKMELSQIKELFAQTGWEITIFSESQAFTFNPPSKTSRTIQNLNHNIFTILE